MSVATLDFNNKGLPLKLKFQQGKKAIEKSKKYDVFIVKEL